ncbi:MAG: YgfZ/GcvT domain-containing protein [Acidimicrobiia bacterium]
MTHARVAHIETPGAVRVVGPDALTFLHSLVSQDLTTLAVSARVPSLLLTPQGKLTASFGITRVDEETLVLDCASEVAPGLADALNRFCIRVRVEVVDATGQYVAVRVRGGDEPPVDHIVAVDAPLPAIDVPVVDDAEWEALRIERGEPRQPLDIDERTIAQEAFLDRDAVSFTKGCFLGQELVCRIDTRGHVNRYLRGVRSETLLEAGTELQHEGATVGVVTSSAVHSDLGAVALAIVRREVEPPAEVSTPDGRLVNVVELPMR